MKDTNIVFVGMGILLLLPLLFYGVRCAIRSKKEKDFKYLYYRLVGVGLVCIALFALLFNVYKFTLAYQPPLVAEQFLEKEGYAYLEQMGFEPDMYSVYLSENTYENDDGSVTIYCQFESDEESIYTSINMKNQGERWKVFHHEIISGDYEDYPEIKKRFYPIKEKP